MLSIRPANVNDGSELKALILEMGEYERMPVVVSEESLALDGFGPRPKFRVLIAEWDDQPAGYAFFFDCYSTFRGRGLFLRRSLRSRSISGEKGWRRSSFACRRRR